MHQQQNSNGTVDTRETEANASQVHPPSWRCSHPSQDALSARHRRTQHMLRSTRYAMMAQKAMGAESRRVRTHVDITRKSMYITPEVLCGVLYPKVHHNGFQKKKKHHMSPMTAPSKPQPNTP